MKCTRKSVEWDELRLTSSSKYVNEYNKYLHDEDNILNCECCPAGEGTYRSCGQHVCWVSIYWSRRNNR